MAIKHTKLIIAAVFAILSVVGTAFACQNFVNAAEEEDMSGAFIQISPTKQKISLEPGESYVSSMQVMNIGTDTFDYEAYATPYSVTDEKYSQSYSERTDYAQIADWITFDEKTISGTLAAGETADVVFTVNVPKDAPAGGQYAAIMAETKNAADTNIQTTSRLGMIFYASIAGETRETGSILENSVPGIVFTPPVTVTSLVENTGNVEATAKYTFKIWNVFDSKETVYNNEENQGTLDIMPGTRRFGTMSWDGAPKLGLFWVEQSIDFLGQTSTAKKLVLIAPLWFIFVIFAIIFFVIFWLVSRARAHKSAGTTRAKKESKDA